MPDFSLFVRIGRVSDVLLENGRKASFIRPAQLFCAAISEQNNNSSYTRASTVYVQYAGHETLHVAQTAQLCAPSDGQNKQRFLQYTPVNGWGGCVLCEVGSSVFCSMFTSCWA